MKKILIGGCSFSQYQGLPYLGHQKWIAWTDYLKKDFDEKFEIINRAQSSFGQSMIVQSLIEELIKNNFEIDHVIVQWSAVGRSYSLSEKHFLEKIINQNELNFAPHVHEYMISNDREGWVTTAINTVSHSFYQSSLIQIFLMKSLLQSKNISYTMFWGWQQVNSGIEKSFSSLLDLIYDEHFWRFNDHGGMSEFIVSNLGKDIGLVGGGDFHPSMVGQKYFYDNIVKTWNFLQ